MVEECGVIEVTTNKLSADDQTYKIECGKEGQNPVGRKVRVRLENTNKPLEIAEISVDGEEYPGGDIAATEEIKVGQ